MRSLRLLGLLMNNLPEPEGIKKFSSVFFAASRLRVNISLFGAVGFSSFDYPGCPLLVHYLIDPSRLAHSYG
jgi:hypothetical protein